MDFYNLVGYTELFCRIISQNPKKEMRRIILGKVSSLDQADIKIIHFGLLEGLTELESKILMQKFGLPFGKSLDEKRIGRISKMSGENIETEINQIIKKLRQRYAIIFRIFFGDNRKALIKTIFDLQNRIERIEGVKNIFMKILGGVKVIKFSPAVITDFLNLKIETLAAGNLSTRARNVLKMNGILIIADFQDWPGDKLLGKAKGCGFITLAEYKKFMAKFGLKPGFKISDIKQIKP
ncbi:MAG: hypothetical protein ABIE43_04815 [Patescibacteria group bacterium]